MDRFGTITFISGPLHISREVSLIFSVGSFRCVSMYSHAHVAGLCMREYIGYEGSAINPLSPKLRVITSNEAGG